MIKDYFMALKTLQNIKPLRLMRKLAARIAMGPPIGPRSSWISAIEAFRADTTQSGFRPVIYAVPPDLLPELVGLGFNVEKIGENGIIELPDFNLSGRKREVIRRSRRKLTERQGASFEICVPPHSSQLIDDLRRVSEAWLQANGGRERGFTIGRFKPQFLDHCPIGLVRINGNITAFASLLTTDDKAWAAIDLMRYDPEPALTNIMDFLLVELILWAKASGYLKFDLAMAPLSGLLHAESVSSYARIGHFIFKRGERFYNFQGLRRFKQKFNPWEPRYIASMGHWSLPILFVQVGLLTNNIKGREA